ncbi:MAG: hypothetical protein K9J17_15990 [Flavobacteriales bacterium]|nr:hypothetical protein [Flavobacteriales bacterium]
MSSIQQSIDPIVVGGFLIIVGSCGIVFFSFYLYVTYFAKPFYWNYRQDRIDGHMLQWNWKWLKSKRAWIVVDIQVICEVCKEGIAQGWQSQSCPTCGCNLDVTSKNASYWESQITQRVSDKRSQAAASYFRLRW